MSKEIKFTRSELVWQTRVMTFDESDWERIKKWVHGYAEKAKERTEDKWYRTFITIWEVVENMSWDEAVEQYKKWNNNEQDALYWIDQCYDGTEFKVYFGEWLVEQMREDVYDADIYNEEYADDSEEYIDVLEDDEDED